MAAGRKRKLVDLEDVGGSFEWSEEGITIFIPQELVAHWPAARVVYDEEKETIEISCED